MKRFFSALGSWIGLISVSLVFGLVVIALMNAGAESYLRKNPDILLTRAERVHENTRSVREGMIPRDKIALLYDLASPDDLKGMWDEYFAAGAVFESFVHFRSRTFDGRFYGTTDAGYRRVKDQGPWPLSKDYTNVFFFGGSTSFGVGPYWSTIASYLQEEMNKAGGNARPVRVYNFGRSGYFSGQEIVLYNRLLTAGHKPDMVIFFDGLNDFCWVDGQPSSWQMLDRYFNEVNDAARNRSAGKQIGTEWSHALSFLKSLPLVRLTEAMRERATAEPEPTYVAPTAIVAEKPESEARLNEIMDRYLAMKKQVEGMSRAFDVTPVFVWQPIPTYKYDTSHHIFNPDRLGCHVNSKFGYPMMAERMRKAGGFGANFLWLADMQETLKEPLYIDAFHYNAPMSRRIAAEIMKGLGERDLLRR